MREILSFCFEQLTDPLSLPLDPAVEYIVLAFIGLLAFKLAYGLVGNMYRSDAIDGSVVGSLFHWLLRLIFFVSIWAITNTVIAVGRFIVEHWLILLTILGGGIAFFFVCHFLLQPRPKQVKEPPRKS